MCNMAGATGLEPATYGSTGRHSNQLSYAPEEQTSEDRSRNELPSAFLAEEMMLSCLSTDVNCFRLPVGKTME